MIIVLFEKELKELTIVNSLCFRFQLTEMVTGIERTMSTKTADLEKKFSEPQPIN